MYCIVLNAQTRDNTDPHRVGTPDERHPPETLTKSIRGRPGHPPQTDTPHGTPATVAAHATRNNRRAMGGARRTPYLRMPNRTQTGLAEVSPRAARHLDNNTDENAHAGPTRLWQDLRRRGRRRTPSQPESHEGHLRRPRRQTCTFTLPPTAPKQQGYQTPHPPTKGKQALAKGGQKEEGQEMGQEMELKAPETREEDKHTTTCAGSKPAHQTH